MSEDRIVGMIWGFSAGVGVEGALFVHPGMIMFSIVAIGASIWFARHNVQENTDV